MKGESKLLYFLGAGVLALAAMSSSVFSVDQRQYAVILQFGRAVRVIKEPGLNFKIPLIQNVEFFDNRTLHIDVEAKELTASDGKRVIVDAFAKLKIVDPVLFYQKVHGYSNLKKHASKNLESAMREVIGRYPLTSLLSSDRAEIMKQIKEYASEGWKSLGVSGVDLCISKTNLPEANSAAIYRSMIAVREKEAKGIRAQGQEEAARIRSKADKEAKILIAKAYAEAESIRGEGDAEASSIYNKAFASDEEFYKFYRHMNTYKNSLQNNSTFILSPKSPFFDYLKLSK